MSTETALQKIEPQSQLPAIVSAPIEPKTAQQTRIDEVAEALMPAYQKASELRLSDKENKALLEPFSDEQVEIRPHDGLLYIPHIHISDRLIRVLGAGEWAMVRRREWVEGNRIYAEYVMKVRGCFVGESVGAMDYHPTNARMNYSDALEGTRGECIRRIAAKDLGCGSQVWNPEYCRQWIAKYAEQERGKWQRKNVPKDTQTTQRQQPAQPAQAAGNVRRDTKPKEPPKATEKTRHWFLAEMRERFSEATLLQWGCDDGPPYALMPNEKLEEWHLDQVPTSKEALQEKIAQCSAFMSVEPQEQPSKPQDEAPATSGQPDNQNASEADLDASRPVFDEEGNQLEVMTGKLEVVSEKSGASSKGKWTRFGLRIGESFWANTFDRTIGELASKCKGAQVKITYREKEKGNELVGFEKVKE